MLPTFLVHMDCNIQNIKCEICDRVFHKVYHTELTEVTNVCNQIG